MEAFIRGIACISPQQTFKTGEFLDEIITCDSARLKCLEPNYKEFINPIKLRRMSRVLKMGVTASRLCLQDADVEQPNGIITGTGLGVMEDTEKFLMSMLDNNETLLTPTSFIQSTHNTVSAHIAVMLKCTNYNLTYVHGYTSFESTILDALMRIAEKPENSILIGGIDELTDRHYKITDSVDYWKKGRVDNLKLPGYDSPGTLAGEGTAFFMLTGKAGSSDYARIRGVKTFYKPVSDEYIRNNILIFLQEEDLTLEDIDLVILGLNGDNRYDNIYKSLQDTLFSSSNIGYYKHLCGEYYTASSFATWLAANIIRHRKIPEIVLANNTVKAPEKLDNILIYNQHQNVNHSLMLLSSC